MGRICPLGGYVLYLDCLECEDKVCKRSDVMPVRKVKGGYKYGTKGKVYSTKSQAAKQGRAIKASQARKGK